MQENIAGKKISQLHDPKKLDQVMRSIFNRTSSAATQKDSRVFISAYCRRLRQLSAMFDGLTP